MNSTMFVIGDTHFGHVNSCVFLNDDGSKLRPWDNSDQMNEDMVRFWNEDVRPNDKVYVLGDAVINRKWLHIFGRLNGEKVLIKGNHDIFKIEEYLTYFKDVRAYHVIDKIIMSHIPIHPDCIERFGTNVHGHLHSKRIMVNGVIDPRYFCVSAEHVNFRPMSLENLRKKIAKQVDNFVKDNYNKVQRRQAE